MAISQKSQVVTYANDALLANKLDQAILDGSLAIALTIGLEVAEVTDMTLAIGWGTVRLAERVDYAVCQLSSEEIVPGANPARRMLARWMCDAQ